MSKGFLSSCFFSTHVQRALPAISAAFLLSAYCGAQAPCSGVIVTPGSDTHVQRLLNGNPENTTFCFQPGLYRFANPISPKNGQQLIAQGPGVDLNGAKVVRHFVASGGNYHATGYLGRSGPSSTNCWVRGSLCNTLQDVFLDGQPLQRVTSVKKLAPGTFYEDFHSSQIWLHDNPAGHRAEQAYAPALIQSSASGVTVKGFIAEKAAVPAQQGAISAAGYSGAGWLLENNEVRYNHGAGITSFPATSAQGGSTIRSYYVHHNGQEGLAGHGPSLVVANNELAFNNRFNYSCEWECGGAKFAGGPGQEIQDLLVTGNHVHDNYGSGFWCDINCYHPTFANNLVTNNKQTDPKTGYQMGVGIFCEISDRCVIHDNTLRNNGPGAKDPNANVFYDGAQILVSATANSEVYNNVVTGANGIGMLQQDRPDSCSFGNSTNYPDGTPVCPYQYSGHYIHWTHDNSFHDNIMTETASGHNHAAIAGLSTDLNNGCPDCFQANNLYRNDSYFLPNSLLGYFTWENSLINEAAWFSYGQD